MATRTQTSERPARITRPAQKPTLSFIAHALNVRNDDPDPFEDYDPKAIARAMLDAGVLDQRNVKLEMAERMVQMSRRQLDPNFDEEMNRRSAPTATTTPKRGKLVGAVLGDLKATTIMRDGRPLGEWTFGEFRKEFAGMAAIISQFSGIADDELMGDHLQ